MEVDLEESNSVLPDEFVLRCAGIVPLRRLLFKWNVVRCVRSPKGNTGQRFKKIHVFKSITFPNVSIVFFHLPNVSMFFFHDLDPNVC